MTNLNIYKLRKRADKALDHIGRLCTGEDRWKMTVPPEDDDSDMLLTAVAGGLKECLDRLERAEAAIERVRDLANQWNATPDYRASDYDAGRVDQRHDCESCQECANISGHNKCCGCYDGACCKEGERDAALEVMNLHNCDQAGERAISRAVRAEAAIERVRAAVIKGSLMDVYPTRMEPDTARESEWWWQSWHAQADAAWRANILAALDTGTEKNE